MLHDCCWRMVARICACVLGRRSLNVLLGVGAGAGVVCLSRQWKSSAHFGFSGDFMEIQRPHVFNVATRRQTTTTTKNNNTVDSLMDKKRNSLLHFWHQVLHTMWSIWWISKLWKLNFLHRNSRFCSDSVNNHYSVSKMWHTIILWQMNGPYKTAGYHNGGERERERDHICVD